MDWIIDHFQVVVVIALVFASWLKHRIDAKAAEREENQLPREWMSRSMTSVPPKIGRNRCHRSRRRWLDRSRRRW